MKLRIAIAVVMLISNLPTGAQSELTRANSQEQTEFGSEEKFQRPVPLPAAAYQALRQAKDSENTFEECAEREGIRVDDIPATWFVASEIQLSQELGSGLIIRAERPCFWEAHIVQFWVVGKSATVYKVLFTGRAAGLRVLPTRSHGYRDLQLVFISEAGRSVDYATFQYSNGTYHHSGDRRTQPN